MIEGVERPLCISSFVRVFFRFPFFSHDSPRDLVRPYCFVCVLCADLRHPPLICCVCAHVFLRFLLLSGASFPFEFYPLLRFYQWSFNEVHPILIQWGSLGKPSLPHDSGTYPYFARFA